MKEKALKEKLGKALLWAMTIFLGCIVANQLNREPLDWQTAVIAGVTVGVVVFLWNVLAEFIRQKKNKKK